MDTALDDAAAQLAHPLVLLVGEDHEAVVAVQRVRPPRLLVTGDREKLLVLFFAGTVLPVPAASRGLALPGVE